MPFLMLLSKTTNTRILLAALRSVGLDRLYQQLDCELGLILTFHRVTPRVAGNFAPNAHLSIAPDFIEAVVGLLRSRGYDLVSMDEAGRRIRAAECGTRFAAMTFDDGYRDVMEHAVPILQEEGIPYALYIAPGLTSGTARLWWEDIEALVAGCDTLVLEPVLHRRPLRCATLAEKETAFRELIRVLTTKVPEEQIGETVKAWFDANGFAFAADDCNRMMNWDEIKTLAADPLCTIGAHTIDHPALARLPADHAREEMRSSAELLDEFLGKRPTHFAYPYGYREAAGPREFDLARDCGFETAVTTRPGMIFPEHRNHMLALPRVSVNGQYQSLRYFSPLLSGLPTRMRQGFRRLDVA